MACVKVKFRSEKDAQFYIDKLAKKSTRKVIPQRSYLCRICNTWHLTSQPNKFLIEKKSAL